MSIEDYNMPIVKLGQESQCLQTSNSSATVAFQVPRTNRPSHTPPSLPQLSNTSNMVRAMGNLKGSTPDFPLPICSLVWY
ncbi:hypothetical protein C343_04395 [Cryptococcus neoformans C23]|uniref:Uncharacterized protein n=2 Tax=Cryptococcus neoformans TaxID=5207 RepID=A0A854Q9F6_CRYNE|nr:hypothetical protein CNAG_07698 [Cryptococcus neoformans var. grubii H99]AUB26177.1 hypothetical protein CKF44_07698 [Cryptococcus neoformans var. grubii]OWZ30692.1 hypothetical protein C347_04454 [Cryptococcus neoformans var. grubii AD2-60a]OWZ38625.1 hypothetical protein C353_04305 [Cryptococcus neoformans var. grubii AD1-83a]OWZ42466.1 hypothetical protein C343_04395 [Cryptococcus neoformans var. grubii C23]OWZ53447.1 hypothetical protein C368_04467 [Cryptococcus neoformans var. grubii 1|eukprot:XP_012050814.1 hypothetical protein CNAG_07698 [Cryptococcus neoformans var. grubii H99]